MKTETAANEITDAYSYSRFSSERQSKGDGLRRQRAEFETALKEHEGWNAMNLFNDLGVSAFKGKNAEDGDLGRFLELCKGGKIRPGKSVLVVECLDRISREKPRKAVKVLEAIVDAGCAVYTTMDRALITAETLDADPMRLMWSIMVFSRAHEESDAKSKRGKARWHNARTQAHANGKAMPCRAPFWCKKVDGKYVEIPERMKAAREVVKLALSGLGQNKLSRHMNDADKIGRMGKGWCAGSIRQLLTSKTLMGTFTPKAGEPIANFYPAVVDEPEFYRLQASMTTRRTNIRGRTGKNGKTGIANLFTGILCDEKGRKMTVLTSAKRKFLVCADCKNARRGDWQSIRYEPFELAFLDFIGEIDITPAARTSRAEAMETELGMLRERKAKLQAAMVDAPDVDTIIAAAKAVSDREKTLMADLETEKAQNATPKISTGDIGTVYGLARRITTTDWEAVRAQLRQSIQTIVKAITLRIERRGHTAVAVAKVTFSNNQKRAFALRTGRMVAPVSATSQATDLDASQLFDVPAASFAAAVEKAAISQPRTAAAAA